MQLNQSAPDFELPDLEGNLHRLSVYRGRIVIVNFWSCECPHSERTDHSTIACLVRWGADVVMLSIATNRSESISSVAEAVNARRLPRVLIDLEHVGRYRRVPQVHRNDSGPRLENPIAL